ncbi:hypothetical protein [Streptomyces sp. NPDC058240]|uniref:hypothetical protein n=1 Tax=Streptomyces sp. NPDC058240 TaxID=3346396 RepID=UPI0036E5C19E
MTRQIELEGPELTPIAAACLEEWQRAYGAGCLDEYDRRYGVTAELLVSEREGHASEQLAFHELRETGDIARQQIAAQTS